MGPGRPPVEKDVLIAINGSPSWLGILISSGATVNNLTTATPFLQAPAGSAPALNWGTTLAGKVLRVHATAAGFIMPSGVNTISMTDLSGVSPGLPIASGAQFVLIMPQNFGWLQWQSASGNLHVFELS